MGGSETGHQLADVLSLFRQHGELSRAEVMATTGLSRSTVNQRLTALLSAGLIVDVGGGASTGGRPSSRFGLNGSRAALLTADVGASGLTVALCDLLGQPLRTAARRIDVWEGPEPVLAEVLSAFDEVLDGEQVWGIGIGVPGPVEFAAGRVVNPPIMTGWDGFDIAGWFAPHHSAPVLVENDANARAVGESRQLQRQNLVTLKLGTGIGAGLVLNGQIIRGDEGAAGDIGHTRAAVATDAPELPCRCGNSGCVEAYASGWALVRDLQAAGADVHDVTDVVDAVRRGDHEAVRLVRQAGRVLGEAVADLVSILNPGMVVLSGRLAECDEVLLSGVRERVYLRALPLATRRLTIRTSDLGESAGVIGLALVTADRIFAPDALDAVLMAPAG